MMDTNSIRQAIEEARSEHAQLLETLKEYEITKLRVEQLESFINMGVKLLGEDKPTDESKPMAVQSLQHSQETNIGPRRVPILTAKPIHDGMIEILGGSSRFLSLKEIAAEFRKRHWKLSERNSREVLRGVLKRNRDLFITKMEGNKLVLGCK